MPLPPDYEERVYAGVLGKIIGVYLGRPFEGWTYDQIMTHLGEINYYVHEKLDVPLIVTDDDISGTFTFLRALPDNGNSLALTPAQIGRTWLNYIIEERTILWWGGLGNSTEHTAYLRLKDGIDAPRSGSIALNSKVVAEQIGAQIFIDGWAMVAPGDPELAADLARRAASVSHDGEAIYGAQVVAAMEAQAFVEADMGKLIDTAVTFIPNNSIIYRLIADLREWHAKEKDWRKTREQIAATYGYDKYGGNCHMVPNHALIIHALLHGEDDFQKTLMIVNTSGWDTDCNSGNVGCLMGIKNGLAGIDAGPDFRGPVADRIYLPTADGGQSITDALTTSYQIVNIGRELDGQPPIAPKNGARFHFELPGSVQGFWADNSIDAKGTTTLENVLGHSELGKRSLAIHYYGITAGRVARVETGTFIPSTEVASYFDKRGYSLIASPTLYSGQVVRAGLSADVDNKQPVQANLFHRSYDHEDKLVITKGSDATISPGEHHEFIWKVDDTGGAPIASIGLKIASEQRADGTIYLDYLTWDGAPDVTLTKSTAVMRHRPTLSGVDAPKIDMWRRAWVNAVDKFEPRWPEAFRLVQNKGRGLLIQGTRDWSDYQVSSAITPHMVEAAGIAARVQGLRRYYALLLYEASKVRLVKVLNEETILAEADFSWQFRGTYSLTLKVVGTRIQAIIDGKPVFDIHDSHNPLTGGAVALICEQGRMATDAVTVKPLMTD
jgi:ADP-ribosylglycohydrolase